LSFDVGSDLLSVSRLSRVRDSDKGGFKLNPPFPAGTCASAGAPAKL
jgi:hypothetical protein